MAIETAPWVDDFRPRYDMPVEEVWVRTEEFLRSRATPEMLAMPFGCYEVDGMDPDSNLFRWVERETFYEKFNNTAEIMDQEYGPYEASSTFYGVVDHQKTMPVGELRIINDSPAGLKSLVDLPRNNVMGVHGRVITPEDVYKSYGIERRKCVDIATAAILRDYRGARANFVPRMLIYRPLFLKYLMNRLQYTHVVAIMDKEAKRSLDDMDLPFRPILGSKPFSYLDDTGEQSSMSEAIIGETQRFYPMAHMSQVRHDQEAAKLTEIALWADSLDADGISEESSALAERARKQARIRTAIALGMRLIMHGQASIGDGDPEHDALVNIDTMISPDILAEEPLRPL